jgi:hypothetical protein
LFCGDRRCHSELLGATKAQADSQQAGESKPSAACHFSVTASGGCDCSSGSFGAAVGQRASPGYTLRVGAISAASAVLVAAGTRKGEGSPGSSSTR